MTFILPISLMSEMDLPIVRICIWNTFLSEGIKEEHGMLTSLSMRMLRNATIYFIIISPSFSIILPFSIIIMPSCFISIPSFSIISIMRAARL